MNAVVFALFFVPIPDSPATPVDADDKRMQGEWSILTFKGPGAGRDGEKEAKKDLIVISGNTLARVSPNGDRQEAAITLDTARKQIIFTENQSRHTGIYRFEGDTLQISIREGATPPKDFKGTGGDYLLVLKRIKAAK
ncbi:MAG: TIGR03067 domain-containing protein [Gemmataceae bacterium]